MTDKSSPSTRRPRPAPPRRGAAGPGRALLRSLAAVAAAALALWGAGAGSTGARAARFDEVGKGVDYALGATRGGVPVHLLRVDPARAALRVLVGRDLAGEPLTSRAYVDRSGALAALNASFFDEKGDPLGLLVADGRTLQRVRKVDWGVFYLDGSGAHVVHTRDFTPAPGVRQAVQTGPRLVVGGVPTPLKPQVAARTALGITRDGRVVALVSADFAPIGADDLAATLVDLGAVDALNLDGGPSSQLHVRLPGGEVVDQPGGTPVPVALGIFADPPPREATFGCSCR